MTRPPDHPTSAGKLDPSIPGKVFGGQWLRRERERVAIGRAKIAARLGISPYNLRKLELMNWTIPAEWIAPLAELGFRVADKDDAAAVPDTVASQAEQSAATVASALVPTPIVDAASSAGDQLTPGFDGESFRKARLRLRLSVTGLAARLRCSAMEIRLLELPERGQEKLVPQAWLTTLRELGFQEPQPHFGDWFRSQRERLGISRDLLAARLGVKAWRLEYLERARPPAQVPHQWLATLYALGFVDSGL